MYELFMFFVISYNTSAYITMLKAKNNIFDEIAKIIVEKYEVWQGGKMKIKIYRAIILFFLICTLLMIFSFSNQNGTQSKGVSTKVTEKILQFSKYYQNADQKNQQQILNRTNAIIRKVAHFSIYTILGLLVMGIMFKTKIPYKRRIYITIIIGILYAILDEFHQSFSPGRTPKITDVYIDTLGIILGILLMSVFEKIYYIYVTNRLQKSQKKS